MKELLKKALFSQPIDDDSSKQLFGEILRGSIVLLSVALFVGVLFGLIEGTTEFVIILTVLWPFYALLPYWLSKNPKTLKASLFIQLISIALVSIAGTYITSGIASPAFHTNLILIIVAGSYFGLRGVIFSWLYCLLSGIVFIILGSYDLLYESPLILSPFVALGIFLIVYLSAGIYHSLAAFIMLQIGRAHV